MRAIPPAASGQFGVFTAAQAKHAGWTAPAIRYALRRGRLVRLRTGVYAEPSAPAGNPFLDGVAEVRRAAAAVALANPRLPISAGAAAALVDLPLARVPDRVCLTASRGRYAEVPGVHLHRARLPAGHLARCGRILLTQTERTIVDVGREMGADSAIAAVDAALRRRWTSPSRLAEVLAECVGWPGTRAAARAVELADARAESALESISRLRICAAGLPLPELQVHIRTLGGRYIGRVDFYWDEFGVVGECDGMLKYRADADAPVAERIRHGELEDTGLILVRWTWADLRTFGPVVHRLQNAFARGLRPDRAPRAWAAQLTPAWHPANAPIRRGS